jgi:hypothetical protein
MMIFISSPYSDTDPRVEEYRFSQVLDYTAWLMNNPDFGRSFIFSPVLHCHPMTIRHKLPGDADFWYHYNFRIIQVCSHIHILAIPGWTTSTGVLGEIRLGYLFDKKIMRADPSESTYKVRPFV